MSEKNLIDEVADNVEALFRELWPYQDQQVPMKAEENAKILAEIKEVDDLPLEERAKHVEERQRRFVEASEKVKEVSRKVSAELARLSEDNYPKDDPETPRRMIRFLDKLSRSYTKCGKQRSAGSLLEYLYSAYDHAYWLWTEWVSACVAIGDRTSAERLLAVLTDPTASSTQAHRFCAEGGKFKPKVCVTKGVIALKFDGDLELAKKYAEAVRLSYAESQEAIQFWRAIKFVDQEVRMGRLQLECIQTGRNGAQAKALLDDAIPPTALVTGKWHKEK